MDSACASSAACCSPSRLLQSIQNYRTLCRVLRRGFLRGQSAGSHHMGHARHANDVQCCRVHVRMHAPGEPHCSEHHPCSCGRRPDIALMRDAARPSWRHSPYPERYSGRCVIALIAGTMTRKDTCGRWSHSQCRPCAMRGMLDIITGTTSSLHLWYSITTTCQPVAGFPLLQSA